MKKRIFGLGLIAVFLSAGAADMAMAKKWFDNPNSGYCKSGQRTADLKKCKENGGKR
jgi:hypothetical protein